MNQLVPPPPISFSWRELNNWLKQYLNFTSNISNCTGLAPGWNPYHLIFMTWSRERRDNKCFANQLKKLIKWAEERLRKYIITLFPRYWSITSPLKYLRKRTKKRALLMIGLAWALSSSWLVPVLGWPYFPGVRQNKVREILRQGRHQGAFYISTKPLIRIEIESGFLTLTFAEIYFLNYLTQQ